MFIGLLPMASSRVGWSQAERESHEKDSKSVNVDKGPSGADALRKEMPLNRTSEFQSRCRLIALSLCVGEDGCGPVRGGGG